MKKIAFLLITMSNKFLIFTLSILYYNNIIPQTKDYNINKYIDSIFNQNLFNGIISISDSNTVKIFKRGFKSIDSKEEITDSSVFCIASVSKVFYAMNILSMVSKNEINYNDKVSKYLIDYPNPATDFITVGAVNNNYKSVSIIVTDIQGKLIADFKTPEITIEQIRQIIDVSNYSKGPYIVTFNIDNKKTFT